MVNIVEAAALVDLSQVDLLKGEKVKSYTKYVSQLSQVFVDSQAAEKSQEIAYEVFSVSLEDGGHEALQYGITVMKPVCVSGECVLTRGHFHEDRSYGEVYQGLSGEGYLLKWDGEDEVILEKVKPGSIHLIDGKYAHRLINTGDVDMAVGAIWSKNAGYNYQAIEEKGFPVRVYKIDGKIEIRNQYGQ